VNNRTIRSIKHGDRDIKIIADTLQSNSLALIFGDHGGTREGRHGGGSKEELESGLFAYSKKNFTFRSFKYPENLPQKTQELLKLLEPAMNLDFLNRRGFNQIDGVPTTAAIFNIPIPFSNLGIIIPEFLHYDNCTVADCLYELLMEFVLNYVQVFNYLDDFVKEFEVMEDQLLLLEKSFNELKKDVTDIMANSEDMFRVEKDYVDGKVMNEQNRIKYINFVRSMFKTMETIREILDDNSLVFKKQWSSIHKHFLYSSCLIRLIMSTALLFLILLLYASLKTEILEIFAHPLTKYYLSLALIVLCFFIYLNIKYVGFFLLIVFPFCIWVAYSIIQIFLKHKNTIKALITAETNVFPTILGLGILFFYFLLGCFKGEKQKSIIHTALGIISGLYLVAFFSSKTTSPRLLIEIIALIIFNRWIFTFRETSLGKNYTFCSTIPTLLFLAIGLYLIIRRVSKGVHLIVRVMFSCIFTMTMLGMFYYQMKEENNTFKDNYFTYIILPRSIFALSVLQMVYLVVSLCFKKLMWRQQMPKQDRIFAFFLFLLTGTIPSLLLLAGAYQQVFYLSLCIVGYGVSYTLGKIGQGNSLFFCTVYFFTMNFFYFATNHVLDFMALRVQRAFVGFPEFKTEINFTIVFFETGGTFSLLMGMLPLLTLMHDSLNDTYRYITQEPAGIPMEITSGTSGVKDKEDEDKTLEITLGRNYFMVLFNFEMIHSGLSIYLVTNFSNTFFTMSPIEFTFRFINWYIHILTFSFLFIIGKI
jgi:hypothetical protein